MWKILALGAGLALVSTSAAMAQPQCDQRESVLQVLQQKYKEQPIALGVTHNGGLVEVLTTGNGNTWSIIVTTPQGMSCLVAAGEGWKAMQQVALDPERSEEHTSELQSLMRNSYAVFCLKKTKNTKHTITNTNKHNNHIHI